MGFQSCYSESMCYWKSTFAFYRRNAMPQQTPRLESLAARERQVVEAVYKLNEASVNDVLANIPDPPSYSAIRAMLNMLVQKGHLNYRCVKNKYFYRPVVGKESAQKSVIRNMLDTFFAGKPTEAVAALLDVAAADLAEDDYRDLKKMIETARKGGR